MKKIALKKLIREETGQVMILVLILLVVGGLIIAPLLSYMGTGLIVGKEVYENKMYEFYAADSGIEDALWKLSNAEEVPLDPELDPYAYDTPWPSATESYVLPELINHKGVTYTITPIWPLQYLGTSGSPTPPPPVPTVIGFIQEIDEDNDEATYQVDLTYDGSLGTLEVDAVKVWLPAAFDYVPDSSEGITTDNPAHPPIECRGGKVLVWDFAGTSFEDLARPEPEEGEFLPADEFPLTRTLTFRFSPAGNPRGAISWLEGTTTGNGDCLAWDTTCEFYKIISTAGSTTIESYTSKENIKEKGAVTLYGDYTAIGNSLMKHTHIDKHWWEMTTWERNCNAYGFRQTPNDPSSADIPSNVPDDAEVFRAYLYWSGWKEGATGEEYTGSPENLEYLAGLVNTATFNGTPLTGTPVNPVRVQILENTYGWSYSCRMNVTELMPESWVDTTYTVGDVNADLGDSGDTDKDNWAYAGWSLVILYSDPSPEAKAHNIFLYDNFLYADRRTIDPEPDFQTHIFTITGFKAPSDSEGVLTCFVGEGDDCWDGDKISFNGHWLPYDGDPYDGINPQNDVWNGESSGLDGQFIDGVDIDTFDVSPYIDGGDTKAEIRLQTEIGIWNMVYIILSLRSDVYGPLGENTVGSMTYTHIYGGGG